MPLRTKVIGLGTDVMRIFSFIKMIWTICYFFVNTFVRVFGCVLDMPNCMHKSVKDLFIAMPIRMSNQHASYITTMDRFFIYLASDFIGIVVLLIFAFGCWACGKWKHAYRVLAVILSIHKLISCWCYVLLAFLPKLQCNDFSYQCLQSKQNATPTLLALFGSAPPTAMEIFVMVGFLCLVNIYLYCKEHAFSHTKHIMKLLNCYAEKIFWNIWVHQIATVIALVGTKTSTLEDFLCPVLLGVVWISIAWMKAQKLQHKLPDKSLYRFFCSWMLQLIPILLNISLYSTHALLPAVLPVFAGVREDLTNYMACMKMASGVCLGIIPSDKLPAVSWQCFLLLLMLASICRSLYELYTMQNEVWRVVCDVGLYVKTKWNKAEKSKPEESNTKKKKKKVDKSKVDQSQVDKSKAQEAQNSQDEKTERYFPLIEQLCLALGLIVQVFNFVYY